MERMTLKKYEVTFRKWDLERRVLIRGFWILTSLYILTFVVYPLLEPLIYTFFAISTVSPEKVLGVPQQSWLPIIVGLGLLYFIAIVVIRLCLIPRSLGRLSKGSCIFTAISAAEDLENGNPVRASLSMDKLLLALSYFLRQKLVALGASYVTPHEFMHVKPEAIPRRAVFRAIQANEDTKDFQERLDNLAIGLHGDKSEGYLIAHQFLTWLDKRAEPYRKGSQSYLDKRPILKTMLLEVAPVILPFISAIVVAIL